MLKSKTDRKICERYSKRDENGLVRCSQCPLMHGNPDGYDFRCKATCHYDRKKKEWVYDTEIEVKY